MGVGVGDGRAGWGGRQGLGLPKARCRPLQQSQVAHMHATGWRQAPSLTATQSPLAFLPNLWAHLRHWPELLQPRTAPTPLAQLAAVQLQHGGRDGARARWGTAGAGRRFRRKTRCSLAAPHPHRTQAWAAAL